MSKEKVLNNREWEKKLKKNGFKMVRQSGGHKIYKRGGDTIEVTVHQVNRMIARRMCKEYDLK